MPEWLTEGMALVQPYWPAIAKVITFWWVGQNMKKRVWTKTNALRSRFYAFMRATMWAHPIAAGIGWGLLFPWMPAIDFVATRGGAVTEGIVAGVVSVAGFMALEKAAEYYGWVWVLNWLREAGRPTSPPPPGMQV